MLLPTTIPSLISIFILASTIPVLISASPSNPANNRFVNSGSVPLVAQNTTSSSPAAANSTNNQLIVQCLPDRFGKNIPLSDCVDALQQISPGDEEYDWWERHRGIRKAHFPLPFRFMGLQSRCYIEPQLAHGIDKGIASLDMVSTAAAAILEKCSSGRKANGGIALGIGGNNAVDVVISTYRGRLPSCRGTIPDQPTAIACRAVLDDMEVSTQSQTWGPSGGPVMPEIILPAVVSSTNHACVLRVFGTADTADWHQVWEATTAVFSTCVRQGMGGSVLGLGDHARLFLTLTSPLTSSRDGNGNGNGTVAES